MNSSSSKSKSADIISEIRSRLTASPALVRKEINVSEWADALGASTTPVREALFQLVGEGLVESIPQKGFFHLPISIRSSKSRYAVIQAILEHKFRSSSSILDFEQYALDKLKYNLENNNTTSKSELIRDLYLALLSGKDDIEAKMIVTQLYLKTDYLRRRLMIDVDTWRDVVLAARLVVECLENEDFEKATAAMQSLHKCKAGRIDQVFNSLAIEYVAEGSAR